MYEYEPTAVERTAVRWLFKGVVLLIVGGAFLTVYGCGEVRASSYASEPPQRLSVEEFVRTGPGENAYIELTDFSATLEYLVTSEDFYGFPRQYLWVPLLPRGGEYDRRVARLGEDESLPTPSFHLILKTSKDENRLETLLAQEAILGLLTNQIDPLTNDEERLLQSSFPSSEVGSYWVFEDGRHPPEPDWSAVWTGLAMLVVGAGATVAWFVHRQRSSARSAAAEASRLARLERRNAR